MAKIIVLAGGGLDSTVLAYKLKDEGYDIDLLSFDYGQRHWKELNYAFRTAVRLDVRHDLVDLTHVGRLLTGSALTDRNVEVPTGTYDAETMKATVVPNRNAIFANIAAGIAVSRGAWKIAMAVHAGDHAVYPDCRPMFVSALRVLLGSSLGIEFMVYAPFLHYHKYQIVKLGAELGVPFSKTWSCYVGGEKHCGRCSTCIERKEAFVKAGVKDPTEYETTIHELFWYGRR